MNEHKHVMSFEMHGIQIDENENYNDVQMSTDTPNLDITKIQETHQYTGQ